MNLTFLFTCFDMVCYDLDMIWLWTDLPISRGQRMTFPPGDLPDLPRRSRFLWEKSWGLGTGHQEQICSVEFHQKCWMFMDFRDVDLKWRNIFKEHNTIFNIWGVKNVTCQDCCAFLRPKLPSEPTQKQFSSATIGDNFLMRQSFNQHGKFAIIHCENVVNDWNCTLW